MIFPGKITIPNIVFLKFPPLAMKRPKSRPADSEPISARFHNLDQPSYSMGFTALRRHLDRNLLILSHHLLLNQCLGIPYFQPILQRFLLWLRIASLPKALGFSWDQNGQCIAILRHYRTSLARRTLYPSPAGLL